MKNLFANKAALMAAIVASAAMGLALEAAVAPQPHQQRLTHPQRRRHRRDGVGVVPGAAAAAAVGVWSCRPSGPLNWGRTSPERFRCRRFPARWAKCRIGPRIRCRKICPTP